MPLPSHHTTHNRNSLSSLLNWSWHNSTQAISPIIFEDHDAKLTAERNREIQLTLDKLEGRLVVASDGQLRRASDGSLDEICGLMSILCGGLRVAGHSKRDKYEMSTLAHTDKNDEYENNHCPERSFANVPQNGDASDYSAYGTGYISSTWGELDLGLDGTVDTNGGDCEGLDLLRGHLQKDKDITHPAFGAFSWEGKDWDTSSRVSNDSLFSEHYRYKPKDYTPSTDLSSLSYRKASAFLRSTEGIWPYLEDQTPSLPILPERGVMPGHSVCINGGFFDPLAIDTTNISLSSTGTQKAAESSPLLSNNKIDPASVTSIQPKSPFIKQMHKIFVKPLKKIGSLTHRTLSISSAGRPSTTGDDLHIYSPIPQRSEKVLSTRKGRVTKHKLRHYFFHKKLSVAGGH